MSPICLRNVFFAALFRTKMPCSLSEILKSRPQLTLFRAELDSMVAAVNERWENEGWYTLTPRQTETACNGQILDHIQ